MLPTVLRRWSCCYLILRDFVVFTMGRVVLSLALLFVLVFVQCLITSPGEERAAGLCDSRVFVCLVCTRSFLSFFSCFWCQWLSAACDCGTPWAFLFTFLPRSVLYIIFSVLHMPFVIFF